MLFSILKEQWAVVLLAFAAVVCALLYVRNLNLKFEITELEHENSALQARLDACRNSLAALQTANAACIERESEIRRDEQAREAVMAKVKTRKRVAGTDDKTEVIDDASRKAVVNRLNRPW